MEDGDFVFELAVEFFLGGLADFLAEDFYDISPSRRRGLYPGSD
jgi:hypothetical protein